MLAQAVKTCRKLLSSDDSGYIHRMVRLFQLLFLCIFCVFSTASVWADSSPEPLRTDTAHRTLLSEMAVLVDKNGDETIDSIMAADKSRFRPLTRVFSAGYTRDVHWLRVELQRENSAPHRWLLEVGPGYLDDVRLYTPAPLSGDGYVERRSGDRLPFTAREMPLRNFVFNLFLPDNTATYVVYLRVQTTSTTIAQLSLWAPTAFASAKAGESLILGMLLGVLCLMLVYSIPHWFYKRERIYLLFIGQVVAMLITFLGNNGIATQYVFPLLPQLTDLFTPVGTCLLNFFGFWFFLEFLEIRQRQPRLAYPFLLVMLLAALALPGAFLDYYVEIAPVLMAVSLLSLPFCLVAAWKAIGEGMLGGRWIFAAYAWYCIAIGLNLMCLLGFLDGRDIYLLGWQYGAPIFVVFLQQAVLTRMREVERKHKEALILATKANARAETEQKLRAVQGQFLSLMAHELKTPLAVIDAAAQALNYIPSNDPMVISRHDRIRMAVGRLNALLEKSLRMLRGEQDEEPLMMPRREHISIVELFSELSVKLEEPRIQCSQSDIASCFADRQLLTIALTNLLDNARKYGVPGKEINLAAIPLFRDGYSGIAFQVSSVHEGDLSEDCEAWFGKFWRGQNSSDQEGVGLGLYLVRTIAETHHGATYCNFTNEGGRPRLVATLWLPERAEPGSA